MREDAELHCAIFEMNGESYRFRESMKTKKSRKAE
jgi:hypothetical protein